VCVVCKMRFTTKEEIVLEAAPQNGTGAKDGYKTIRHCKGCQAVLSEANLINAGDRICLYCKSARAIKLPRKPRRAYNKKLPDDRGLLVEIYQRPTSLKVMAKMYNVTPESVRQQLLKAGVTMRPKGATLKRPKQPLKEAGEL
jgi:hypothetical protein